VERQQPVYEITGKLRDGEYHNCRGRERQPIASFNPVHWKHDRTRIHLRSDNS